jgi:hypothetical protein
MSKDRNNKQSDPSIDELANPSAKIIDTSDSAPSKSLNRRRKTLHKIVKGDSSLSFLKIAATALTAVSMALISTKLTSLVNSLTLVALVSIGSAIVSEFYRVILSVTSIGAKKVIAPIIQINPDGTTTEIPIVTIVSPQAAEEPKKKGFIAATRRYLKRNPFIKIAILFALVSGLTIAASYSISTANGVPVNNYTTVHEKSIEQLSTKDKQQIIDAAVSTSESHDAAKDFENKKIIESLTSENASLKKDLESLSENQNKYIDSIVNLETRIESLEKSINDSPSMITVIPSPSAPITPIKDPNAENSELTEAPIESILDPTIPQTLPQNPEVPQNSIDVGSNVAE